MAFVINKKNKFIIDKTMIAGEIDCKASNKNNILKMLFMLKTIGVDYFEIDYKFISIIGDLLPKNIKYIYRINNMEECDIYLVVKFNKISIEYNVFLNLSEQKKKILQNKQLFIEVDYKDINNKEKISLLEKSIYEYKIFCIRIINICETLFLESDDIIKLIKESLNNKIYVDVCADNRIDMATAVAVEAVIHDVDFVTTSFLGIYNENGLAATEEVILAVKCILNANLCGNTSILKDLTLLYEELTGKTISGIKPVVGRDIFKYESGVHADGIEKNPATYEPYDPAIVGLARELIIGKYSGSKAVKSRIESLGINYNSEDISGVLKLVREKSIELKRGLKDEELIEICKRVRAL